MADAPINDYAATSLPEVRSLLTDLNHESRNMSGYDAELMKRAEETIRWLLGEYLKRGEMVEDPDA